MTTFLRTLAIIFLTHLPRMLRSRRMIMMLVLAAIPVIPVVLIEVRHAMVPTRSGAPMMTVLTHVTWFMLFQAALPLIALLGGSAVVAEEIADRTVVYVLTRPVSRVGFLLGRYLATLCAVLPALAVSFGLILLVAAQGPNAGAAPLSFVSTTLASLLLGGVVYTALFSAISAWIPHPMPAGLAYAFAFEALFANLPGTTQKLAIQYHLREFLVGYAREWWAAVGQASTMKNPSGPGALATLLWILAVALTVGCVVVARKQYRVAS